jgi:hypothetical protein
MRAFVDEGLDFPANIHEMMSCDNPPTRRIQQNLEKHATPTELAAGDAAGGISSEFMVSCVTLLGG